MGHHHPHSHPHKHGEEDRQSRLNRLKKISGQIAGIVRMVEEDRDCPDILMQLVSVRKAVKSLAHLIIHQHAEQCIAGAKDAAEAHAKLHELLTVLEQYVD